MAGFAAEPEALKIHLADFQSRLIAECGSLGGSVPIPIRARTSN